MPQNETKALYAATWDLEMINPRTNEKVVWSFSEMNYFTSKLEALKKFQNLRPRLTAPSIRKIEEKGE